jgi:hypothetical protein
VQRKNVSLDGTWDFYFSGDTAVPFENVPLWRHCAVPAPWQAQFDDLRLRNGRAWYRRSFDVPAEWLTASVFVTFGAVNYFARVLVNGTSVAEHEGGYLPFEADISAFVRPGRNEIAVEVVAPTDDPALYPEFPFAEIPFGKQSWYGPLGGIWQSVAVERRAVDHIRKVRLTPALADGKVAVDVRFGSMLGRDCELEIEVEAPDRRVVASLSTTVHAGDDRAALAVTVPSPCAWSPETPHLYRLTATLRDGDAALDERTETFGFRTIETRDGRILLNGKPIFLRAALDQDYYPEGICTVPSEAFLEDQFRKAKALGLNCIRCHIKVPDPRYYEVADRIGLLIWTELPNAGRLTERAAIRAEETLRGIVERDGNHPSIICWTIINENWGTDLVHDESHRAWLTRMYEWLKAADPTRLVVDNSPLAPSFHVRSDLEDIHFYAAIPDHRAAWDGFVEGLASRPDWTYSPHSDAQRTGREPLLCSEFGNWGLPDPAALKGADGREPWWFETGHDWGEGVMYPHGIENRFRACGLDKVFGGLREFVEAAQWQQYRALKYQLETMRRQPTLAGYVITEFTDCHWESNGLLDMRRNPRVFHHMFGAINAETVVIPRWDRVAYWEGEPVEIGLAAANGGGDAIDGAEISWSVDAAGLGGAEPVDVAPAGVHAGRAARFHAPKTGETASIHRVEFELTTDAGILATNHLDLAIYPARNSASAQRIAVWSPDGAVGERLGALGYRIADGRDEADVVVATALDGDLCTAIRDGARVVLLLDGPCALQPVFPHWQAVHVVSRAGTQWQGDWASSFSWLRRRGPFAGIPGGPLLDHAFDRVIPNHVIANCNTLDFQARVHAGIVVGWVHKPAALLVERDYGLGRMAATTFRLLEDAPGADPTATALLDGLIALAAMPLAHQPKHLKSEDPTPLPA